MSASLRLVNLTPHPITIVGGDTIAPTSPPARVSTVSAPAGDAAGIPLVSQQYGDVVGLPDPQPGVLFIVSAVVRAAVPHRLDVASPGDLVRDGNGQPIGCRNLVVNVAPSSPAPASSSSAATVARLRARVLWALRTIDAQDAILSYVAPGAYADTGSDPGDDRSGSASCAQHADAHRDWCYACRIASAAGGVA